MGDIIFILWFVVFFICLFFDSVGSHGTKTVYHRGARYTVKKTPLLDWFGVITIIAYIIYLIVAQP